MTDSTPGVSLFMTSFNNARFVEEAAHSALNQDYPNLQVIFTDNCSDDGTYEILERVVRGYQGPHEVVLNRNETNRGVCGNVNAAVELSEHEILMRTCADDVLPPNLVQDCVVILMADPERMSVSPALDRIDGAGQPLPASKQEFQSSTEEERSLKDYVESPFHHIGAARMFRKTVFETFGPLSENHSMDDTATLFRSLLLGTSVQSKTARMEYRVHGTNISIGTGYWGLNFDGALNQYLKDLVLASERGFYPEATLNSFRDTLIERHQELTMRRDYVRSSHKLPLLIRESARRLTPLALLPIEPIRKRARNTLQRLRSK